MSVHQGFGVSKVPLEGRAKALLANVRSGLRGGGSGVMDH